MKAPNFFNPFLPNVPFRSPYKHQKSKGFLMFSGGSKGNYIEDKRVTALQIRIKISDPVSYSGNNNLRVSGCEPFPCGSSLTELKKWTVMLLCNNFY